MKLSIENMKDQSIPIRFDELELVNDIYVVVNTKSGLVSPIHCQVRESRSANSSVVHAAIWISGKCCYGSGYDSAEGGSYCKVSSAIGGAISVAGIKIPEGIDGRGLQAVRDALIAITRKLGYKGSIIVTGV